jgi:protein gp37
LAETTEISWTHSTFNPWYGCTKVSPGCDHCYAEHLMDKRFHKVKWGAGEPRKRSETWDQPLLWNRKAAASGKPWRVFCASLADVFDNEVPEEWRQDLYALIGKTPHLTWMLLTKRIGNAPRIRWPKNVWIGATMINQEEYDRDKAKLLATDAHVRFISAEPLLGPIKLGDARGLDWVIVGGESGANARIFDPSWARSIRDQCATAGIACFVKQLGRSPQEVAYPGNVTDTEASRWMADGWSRIWEANTSHWRRFYRLKDRSGATPEEWPADLRVQQFPA